MQIRCSITPHASRSLAVGGRGVVSFFRGDRTHLLARRDCAHRRSHAAGEATFSFMSILLRSAAARPLLSLNEHIRARPIAASIAITASKAAAADLMVQTVLEQRHEVDWRRTSTFLIFGGCYQGCFQYFIFNNLFERLFPGRAMIATVQKILAANLVADPIFFFPTFYTLKEALATSTLRPQTVRNALSKYYDNCLIDWRNTWATWLPGHVITFALPTHLRMPWIAAVSFGYVSLLSWTRGEHQEKRER